MKVVFFASTISTVLFFVVKYATLPMAFATFSYSLLCFGLYFRKSKKVHVPLMLSGILIDLGIVLTLEVQRQAINTAISFTLGPLQQTHIFFSALATLLYFPVIAYGLYLLKNPNAKVATKKAHLKIGMAAFIFRTLGFVMMFSLLIKKI